MLIFYADIVFGLRARYKDNIRYKGCIASDVFFKFLFRSCPFIPGCIYF